MFGRDSWEMRREMRDMEKELSERAERASYRGYQSGQSAGFKEGEEIGYGRGWEDGKKRGINICLQILENRSKKPEDLAEEFDVSIDIVNKVFQYLNRI